MYIWLQILKIFKSFMYDDYWNDDIKELDLKKSSALKYPN